jgi:hypothetical protein
VDNGIKGSFGMFESLRDKEDRGESDECSSVQVTSKKSLKSLFAGGGPIKADQMYK